MSTELGILEILASLILVVPVVLFSVWAGLNLERAVLIAIARAVVQLLAVGVVFKFIFEADNARLYASAWIVAMVVLAGTIIQRRAPGLPHLRAMGIAAIGAAALASSGVIIGLGILDFEPVAILLVAGISIGNTLPSCVLAADLTRRYFQERIGEQEALLALGMSVKQVNRIAVSQVAGVALIQQIERTRVVGLIAIPGTMTGLLLAGVSPIQAVLMQIVVMHLVLGSTALGVLVITISGSRGAFTSDARLAPWTRQLE